VSDEIVVAVVDDDDSLRTALVDLLVSLGYAVHAFASAEDFIASGDREKSACLITDIHLPGMSGFELLRLLASFASKVPVIMITARDERGLEAKATAAGAICFLRKPFESKLLIGCLESAGLRGRDAKKR
jgi:FixJ family two-component response regulator